VVGRFLRAAATASPHEIAAVPSEASSHSIGYSLTRGWRPYEDLLECHAVRRVTAKVTTSAMSLAVMASGATAGLEDATRLRL
jgi:hypothetical protein